MGSNDIRMGRITVSIVLPKLIPIILLTKVENNTNKQSACCQYQSNEVRHELNILSSFSFILAMVRIVVFADS